MDYFSLSKVKRCFQAEKKERKKERQKEVRLKSLFHVCFFRYFEQPLGGADPALVGGCVLPVLSFNTNEEELVMGAFGEEHSVKTAAHVYKGIG